MLGGDVLNIELTTGSVYACYEHAVLKYSKIVNIHQAKNSLASYLGHQTGTFDHRGQLQSSSIQNDNVELKFPKFTFSMANNIGMGLAAESRLGGNRTVYSASIEIENQVQDYDLQTIVSSNPLFSSSVGNRRITIKKIYHQSALSMWRYFGNFGNLNAIGNLQSYGQYANDSTFEIIPTWQNKLQAMAFEDALWTRTSHYSYELRNNKLRIFPVPSTFSPRNIWFDFTIDNVKPWEDEEQDRQSGVGGINNMNTLPFVNIPYENINSIGKQWIREYALACSEMVLSWIRTKYDKVPIPGESIVLNGPLLQQHGSEQMKRLEEQLIKDLDDMAYPELLKRQAETIENATNVQKGVPMLIYVG